MSSNETGSLRAGGRLGEPLRQRSPPGSNRLPNIWQEVVLRLARYAMGAPMRAGDHPRPPDPSLAWGRLLRHGTRCDSWVKRSATLCSASPTGGKNPATRRELVRRRRRHQICTRETSTGCWTATGTRIYLATRWSASKSAGATLRQFLPMSELRRVEVAVDARPVDGVELRPRRPGGEPSLPPRGARAPRTACCPLPGWDPGERLARCCGRQKLTISIHVNHGQQRPQPAGPGQSPSTCPSGPTGPTTSASSEGARRLARSRRCPGSEHHGASQPQAFHGDPPIALCDTPRGGCWPSDGPYAPDSLGAFLFEEFYPRTVLRGLRRRRPRPEWPATCSSRTTVTFVLAFRSRARRNVTLVCGPDAGSPLPPDRRRSPGRDASPLGTIPTATSCGTRQQTARFFGFDRGPVSIAGGRATIHRPRYSAAAAARRASCRRCGWSSNLAGDNAEQPCRRPLRPPFSPAGMPANWASWLRQPHLRRIRLDPPGERSLRRFRDPRRGLGFCKISCVALCGRRSSGPWRNKQKPRRAFPTDHPPGIAEGGFRDLHQSRSFAVMNRQATFRSGSVQTTGCLAWAGIFKCEPCRLRRARHGPRTPPRQPLLGPRPIRCRLVVPESRSRSLTLGNDANKCASCPAWRFGGQPALREAGRGVSSNRLAAFIGVRFPWDGPQSTHLSTSVSRPRRASPRQTSRARVVPVGRHAWARASSSYGSGSAAASTSVPSVFRIGGLSPARIRGRVGEGGQPPEDLAGRAEASQPPAPILVRIPKRDWPPLWTARRILARQNCRISPQDLRITAASILRKYGTDIVAGRNEEGTVEDPGLAPLTVVPMRPKGN